MPFCLKKCFSYTNYNYSFICIIFNFLSILIIMKTLIKTLITKTPLYHVFTDFITCGIIGWCMEILFTAFHAFRKREMSLTGHTSLWMFPIYGSIAFLKPLFILTKHASVFFRGTCYALLIFVGEFISGTYLCSKNQCPWNYAQSKWNINGVIRLDYFPYWFLAGLFYERLLTSQKAIRH